MTNICCAALEMHDHKRLCLCGCFEIFSLWCVMVVISEDGSNAKGQNRAKETFNTLLGMGRQLCQLQTQP